MYLYLISATLNSYYLLIISLLGTLFPGSRSHFEASCALDQEIWPLALLGHTHDLGTKVTGKWYMFNF